MWRKIIETKKQLGTVGHCHREREYSQRCQENAWTSKKRNFKWLPTFQWNSYPRGKKLPDLSLSSKVGQNHQARAMEVKPKWKQKSLGMVSQSEMVCGQWHLHVDNDIYWEKRKIKLESLTFKQGNRNLLISKQKSSKPLVKPHGPDRTEVPWIPTPSTSTSKDSQDGRRSGTKGRPESACQSLFRLLAYK